MKELAIFFAVLIVLLVPGVKAMLLLVLSALWPFVVLLLLLKVLKIIWRAL